MLIPSRLRISGHELSWRHVWPNGYFWITEMTSNMVCQCASLSRITPASLVACLGASLSTLDTGTNNVEHWHKLHKSYHFDFINWMAPLLTRNNDDSTIDLPKVCLNSLHHLSKDRGTVPCRQTWKRKTRFVPQFIFIRKTKNTQGKILQTFFLLLHHILQKICLQDMMQ